MCLCFALGVLFSCAIVALDLPPDYDPVPSLPPAELAGTGGSVAEIGGFMAYRGFAALAITVSVAAIILSVVMIRAFVLVTRARIAVFAILAAQIFLATAATIFWGSGMSQLTDRMVCHSEGSGTAMWDFCRNAHEAAIGTTLHLDFHTLVNVVCAAATVAVVFGIFVIASSAENPTSPEIIRSPEKSVTLLMISASALLIAVLFLDKGLLNWALSDHLAVTEPPVYVRAYIDGTSSYNGAVETSLLAITWFIALLLLHRGGDARSKSHSGSAAGMGSLSIFNMSAIFAPILSAMASDLLGG